MPSVRAASPLLLNGYALVVNTGASSLLGVVFWMLATRFYDQDQVGLGAALISTMMTISYLAQMNLSSLLVRFLPLSGAGAGRLILRAHAFSGIVAAIVALGFALGVGWFSEPLDILRTDPVTTTLFVAGSVIWTWFALQDAVLSGLRKSILVPAKNVVYAVLKIVFLVALALAVLPDARMLFLAWVAPLALVVVAVNTRIFRNLLPARSGLRDGVDPKPGDLLRFLGWDTIGTFSLAAAFGLAPVMVTAAAGVEANASYHLAWTLAYSVYLVGRSMSTSLIAEGAARPARLCTLISDTLLHALILVCGAVAVMVTCAPLIMSIFGAAYVTEGAAILRVLALGCIPWAVTTVYISAARARGETRKVAVVQLATLSVFAAASALLVSDLGALGVAAAWLIANSLLCLLVVAIEIRNGPRGVAIDWVLALAGSAARMIAGLRGSLPGTARNEADGAQRVLAEIREIHRTDETAPIDATDMAPVSARVVGGRQSDVTSVILEPGAGPKAGAEDAGRRVLKYATSENGMKALRRNANTLSRLASDDRLDPFRAVLPRVAAFRQHDGLAYCIETEVKGTEGRRLLADTDRQGAAVIAATAIMHDLHRCTAAPIVIDEDWLHDWVDLPIRSAAAYKGVYWPRLDRGAAWDGVRQALREVLLGRRLPLGIGHGDLWFGNIFFADVGGAGPGVVVSGLIDWDTARADAPAGWDATHLALATRMHESREELGAVVAALLREGGWSTQDRDNFAKAGLGAWLGDDREKAYQWAMVVLTWLHHVAAGMEKSDHQGNNALWTAANIDRVLAAIAQVPRWCRNA